MQSHIKIKLKFKCIIGILDFERQKKQVVIIKIKAKSDIFLDYAQVTKHIKQIYKKQKFQTIEESLEFSSQGLKQAFPQIYELKITVIKPHIIKNTKVGASIKKFF